MSCECSSLEPVFCKLSRSHPLLFTGDANELEVVGHRPPILCDWKDHKTLGLLNLMYDVTPNDHITTFITEIGLLPDTSIPKVLNTRVSLYET